MKKIVYTQEKMERVKERVQKMISIVRELEADFPGRPFTLDGHLVGSIGEVMAAYYYGNCMVLLSKPMTEKLLEGRYRMKLPAAELRGIKPSF